MHGQRLCPCPGNSCPWQHPSEGSAIDAFRLKRPGPGVGLQSLRGPTSELSFLADSNTGRLRHGQEQDGHPGTCHSQLSDFEGIIFHHTGLVRPIYGIGLFPEQSAAAMVATCPSFSACFRCNTHKTQKKAGSTKNSVVDAEFKQNSLT